MNNNGWTQERRRKQSEAIKKWQPWTHSTGPRSEKGKEAAKMNAYKHGAYSQEMALLKAILKTMEKPGDTTASPL